MATITLSLQSQADQDARLARAISLTDPFQHRIPTSVGGFAQFDPFTLGGEPQLAAAARYVEVRVYGVQAQELGTMYGRTEAPALVGA